MCHSVVFHSKASRDTKSAYIACLEPLSLSVSIKLNTVCYNKFAWWKSTSQRKGPQPRGEIQCFVNYSTACYAVIVK